MTTYLKLRQQAEREIIRATIQSVVDHGWTLDEDDHDEPNKLHTVDEAVEAVTAVDDCRIYFTRNGDRQYSAWVYFVQGNDGWDVVSDYTVNLDDAIDATKALVDSWEERMS